MSSEQRERFGFWVEIIFKIGTPVAGLIIAFAVLFMSANFASRPELERTNERITAIEKILIAMQEANKVDDRQDILLHDHEQRLRTLEKSTR